MKRFLVLLSTLCSLPVFGQVVPATPAPEPDIKAIAEFGADVLPFAKGDFHKWADSPQLSCIGEAADIVPCKPYVDRFVSDFNAILSGLPIRVTTAPDNTATATFRIYIGRKAAIARARRANGVNSGSPSYTRWNIEKFITDYSLYIDLDEYTKWTPVEQRAALYRYLLDGMGYCGGEAIKGVPSVYSNWRSEPILTEYDRKMIRFAYEHLTAGSSKSDIRQAVRKKWDLVQLPKQ